MSGLVGMNSGLKNLLYIRRGKRGLCFRTNVNFIEPIDQKEKILCPTQMNLVAFHRQPFGGV